VLFKFLYQAQQRNYDHRYRLGRAALENVQKLFNCSDPSYSELLTSDAARAEYAQSVIEPATLRFIYANPDATVRSNCYLILLLKSVQF
jgi:hypothetical protein